MDHSLPALKANIAVWSLISATCCVLVMGYLGRTAQNKLQTASAFQALRAVSTLYNVVANTWHFQVG